MAFSSSSDYRAGYRIVAREARALSHPARVLILDQLRERPLTLAELVEEHPISRQTVCAHLGALGRAGLVRVVSRASPALYESDARAWSATVRQLVSAARAEDRRQAA